MLSFVFYFETHLVVAAGKLRVSEEHVVRGEEGRRYGLGHVQPESLEGVHLCDNGSKISGSEKTSYQQIYCY